MLTVLTAAGVAAEVRAGQRKLPRTRQSVTHKFDIQGHEGYIIVGIYPDGSPGELFISMAKEGSTIGGLMDALGLAVSLGWQYGVPLDVLVEKFSHTRFEPSGSTQNPDIPAATSILDYIFRWLGLTFLGVARAVAPSAEAGVSAAPAPAVPANHDRDDRDKQFARFQRDAPACPNCGAITVRNGACYRCVNCGESLGCS